MNDADLQASAPRSTASEPSVALVNLPFHQCLSPPIGLGILKSALSQAGLGATVYNLNLELLPELHREADKALELYRIFNDSRRASVGEWLFAPPDDERDERYLARLPDRGFVEREVELFASLRPRVPELVQGWARRIVAAGHDVVGFSVFLERTRAAVRLASEIKRLAPATRLLLGGYSASGDMGAALLEAFPVFDLVCHGEGEELIVPLVRALRQEPGHRLEALRGISYRQAGRVVSQRDGACFVDLERSPLPDYHDYFDQLRATSECLQGELDLPHWLPMESARGCWWGEHTHCTFCGLNGDRLAFRSKSAERVLQDVKSLHEEYGLERFLVADNILSQKYYETLLPRLAPLGRKFVFQWEVRPNLNRAKVELLERAGVWNAQPGIESLSTPVLRLMKKGTTAVDNIQTLKLCQEQGIEVRWNILYSFPGEQLEWYEQVARAIPRLMHLSPPEGVSRIAVHRYSPHFERASEMGVKLLGPKIFTRLAFSDVPPDLVARLASDFEYEIEGRPAQLDQRICELLNPRVAAWRAHYEQHGCTLSIIDGPDEALIVEGPLLRPERIVRVKGPMLRLLRACASVRSDRRVQEQLAAAVELPPEGVPALAARPYRGLIGELSFSGATPQDGPEVGPTEAIAVAEERGWVHREEGRLLSLPANMTRYVQSPTFQFEAALRRYES